jgi:hypothetical protein
MNVGVPCTGPVANNAPVGFCISHAARDELSELLGRGLLRADMNRQDGVDRSFGQAANLDLAMICHEEGGGNVGAFGVTSLAACPRLSFESMAAVTGIGAGVCDWS